MVAVVVALLALCAVGCAADLDTAWDQYTNATIAAAPHGLQPSCVPRRFRAEGPYKGLVVLFHGYSACPQQFDDLAPLLAAQGMEVLVPLVPGMGNKFNNSAPAPSRWQCPLNDCNGPLDDVTNLPNTPQGYLDFVSEINHIAELASPPRAVGGLSVGGALAAHAGQIALNGSPLYTRQLIMNPLLRPTNKVEEAALKILNLAPWGKKLWFGWGEGCRVERSLGRAGICTFQVQDAMASGDFGVNTLNQLAMPSNVSIAVLYDQGDPVVETSAIRELAAKYRQQVGADEVQSCWWELACPGALSAVLILVD